jgi:hypothetical protein
MRYSNVADPVYAGYGTATATVPVGDADATQDLSVEVDNCQAGVFLA